jgi:hypothetical protein
MRAAGCRNAAALGNNSGGTNKAPGCCHDPAAAPHHDRVDPSEPRHRISARCCPDAAGSLQNNRAVINTAHRPAFDRDGLRLRYRYAPGQRIRRLGHTSRRPFPRIVRCRFGGILASREGSPSRFRVLSHAPARQTRPPCSAFGNGCSWNLSGNRFAGSQFTTPFIHS